MEKIGIVFCTMYLFCCIFNKKIIRDCSINDSNPSLSDPQTALVR